MPSSQRLNLAFSSDKGPVFPFTATVATPAINVFGTAPWQIGAVQTQTINLTYSAWTGVQDKAFSFALTGFPQTISLPNGTSGIIFVSVAVGALPQSGVMLDLPVLQIVFGSGSPNNIAGSGTATFTLQVGRKYGAPSLSGTVRAYAPTGSPQQVIPVNVWAMLLGRSS